MSGGTRFVQRMPYDAEVLDGLLHSLSQPLTGLQCSLELAIHLPAGLTLEEVAQRRRESVVAALEQTERVIALVQLLREQVDGRSEGREYISGAEARA